jgi:putative transposase
MIISLYAGGMTIRDIQAHLERTLGTQLSHETISNITDAVGEEVKAWQSRPLESVYPIMYLDALIVKVRDTHQVRNKAAHIAVGVDCDGSSMCSASGCKPLKAPNSGPVCWLSFAIAAWPMY